MTARRDRTAAERQRRRRERMRWGLRVVSVEVPDEIVDGLIERGFLAYDKEDDKEAIGAALVRFVLGRHA